LLADDLEVSLLSLLLEEEARPADVAADEADVMRWRV
jgi:hypothetical protein